MKRIYLILPLFFLIAGHLNSQNLNVMLADQLSYGSQVLSNISSWKDPQDGKEYALVGGENGLSIVDVSNPNNVVQITQIPGPSCDWREIKTNGNYAYVTTECDSIGLQIVNLTNLPATNLQTATWTPTINTATLKTIHALHIDNGKVYLYGTNISNKGAIIADITTNPMVPIYLGKYDPRYVHDGYVRNDTLYACHIYDGDVAIVNMSNPNNQTPLATFTTPNNFSHNSWLSENSKICFTTDEVNDSYLASYDISDLNNITELDRIQSNPNSNSVVHNTHIIKKNGAEYAVTSWYKDGFTIVDVTRPKNMVQVGYYDTAPTGSGGGMQNNWGVDPFLPSGTIVASDISNGLFVLTPTYVRGCYLEGIVSNCSTGNPVSGYTVTIQLTSPKSDAHVDVTDATGNFAVGVAAPGTYQVVFSKTGSQTLTYSVSLTAGNVITLNPMVSCPSFTLMGKVFNTATSTGVPSANVKIQSGSNIWNTITDVAGNYTVTAFPPGTYEIVAGKWGFITGCLQNESLSSTTGLLSIGISAGIYDDFSWDWGWTETGTATTGSWVRGEPKGTTDNGNSANPNYDVNNDCSQEAYITGNTGATSLDDDVDGGNTKLTSPVFNLTPYSNPYIYYSRWFYNAYGTPNDSLIISIENGATTKVVEKVLASTTGKGTWINKSFRVSQYLTPTSTMKMIVHTEDIPGGNIVEAAFDMFYVLDSGLVSVNAVPFTDAVISLYPNPFNSEALLEIKGVELSNANLEFIMYDVVGKETMRLPIYDQRLLIIRDGLVQGMYFYKVTDHEKVIGAGKLVIK